MTPAFTADCLETLEEIRIAGRATFRQAGGESFEHIPCLNDHPAYIDFLAGRASVMALRSLLAANRVACHPAVRGEIALGSIARRDEVLRLLSQLPRAPVIGDDEVFAMIETRNLDASGIGWIDAHLLASAMAGQHLIWTGDKRLASVAARLGVLAVPAGFEPK